MTKRSRVLERRAGGVSSPLLEEFNRFLSERVGLHFPRERAGELGERLGEVTRELGQPDTDSCIRWLMSSPLERQKIEALASQLTVGETYFFREPDAFEAIERCVLPELIRARERERRLRIWSAGCSSGEEPYSLAILLDRLGDALQGWHITLCATDINPRVLRQAAEARYGDWSFRAVAPELRLRYFTASGGRLELRPGIRERVTFSYLNLAGDHYPSLMSHTTGMDLIVCRNVLMYFAPDAVTRVAGKLLESLADGGWLVVGAAETPLVRLEGLRTVRIGDATLFQKCPAADPAPDVVRRAKKQPPCGARLGPFEVKRAAASPRETAAAQARVLANAGRLEAALACSHRALAADPLDPAAHYLHALIEIEAGHADEAACALRKATYLAPGFVMAHFALAGIALGRGRYSAARRQMATVRDLLRGFAPCEALPESDGMSAATLAGVLDSMEEQADGPAR